MFGDDSEDPFGLLVRPFWFVLAGGLLEEFWQAEAKVAAELMSQFPEAGELLDTPEATQPQRCACLSLLFWRAVLDLIWDRFGVAYQNAPDPPESVGLRLKSLYRLHIPPDAPGWALEVERALRDTRRRIVDALPPALQSAGGDPNDSLRIAEIQAAQQRFDTLERLHEMLDGVLKAQQRRLARRWSAVSSPSPPLTPPDPAAIDFRQGPDSKSVHWDGRGF